MNCQSNGTILVADDRAINCEYLEHLLSREGFTVVAATDGTAALKQFKRHQPDLVLLDVIMPHLNGFEVCRQIKSDKATALTPVILVTALSDTEDRVKGIEAGADDFLTKPVDRSELLARVRSLMKLKARTDELERAESVLFALAQSIEAKDPHTQNHCERLAGFAARLGQRLGLPAEQITALERAGIVHDIGKVAVPDSILLKPARLTEDERKIMRDHPVVGERICSPLKSFRLVLPIIRHHHEKRDGSGYPDGLRGQEIPLSARILQIVDVYDALTTTRPYKEAYSSSESLEIMAEETAKGWWDPELLAEFRALVDESSAIGGNGTAGLRAAG